MASKWKMALNNNQLYIGAKTCNSSVTTGCLSIVDVTTGTAAPHGACPWDRSPACFRCQNRNVVYAVQGGALNIYDTTTNKQQSTQIGFPWCTFSTSSKSISRPPRQRSPALRLQPQMVFSSPACTPARRKRQCERAGRGSTHPIGRCSAHRRCCPTSPFTMFSVEWSRSGQVGG